MINLTELVINYQKTKSNLILDKIFKCLSKVIKKKAVYLFRQRHFNNVRLCELHSIELEDIEQEIYLELMRMINKYDKTICDFDKYFYTALYNHVPAFLNRDFFNQLKNVSITPENYEDGETLSNIDKFEANKERNKKEIKEIEFKSKLTEGEQKVFNILKSNPNLNYSEVARKMRLTRERVRQICEQLRKKLK